jgi:hypothetical protein
METEQDHLGGLVEHSEGKGGESVVTILRFLCGSLCLCWLSTEGLVLVSKYCTYRSHAGDMGLVSLVACHQQKLGLSLLLHWLAWERNQVRTCRSVSRHTVDCFGSPFSWEQWDLSKSVNDSWKVATYEDCLQEVYIGRTWTGGGSIRAMLIRFSPVGCTSIRIAATLEYELPLVRGCHQVVIYWIND